LVPTEFYKSGFGAAVVAATSPVRPGDGIDTLFPIVGGVGETKPPVFDPPIGRVDGSTSPLVGVDRPENRISDSLELIGGKASCSAHFPLG
jgi:hypothetical protein